MKVRSRPRNIIDRLLPSAIAFFLAMPAAAEEPPGCATCHPDQAAAFSRSAMADAARGEDFLAEQATAPKPRRCLRCHAPNGGPGVGCSDCHGAGPHPYPKLQQPAVCARCHDAPGENTVRSFLASPAAAADQRCSDCHATAGGRFSHDFRGPTRKGFLDGVASLRLFLRQDPEATIATIRIRHRAGHALPGGTTGRAVWLRVQGLDRAGSPRWNREVRFGWEHLPGGEWRDRTLPAGQPTRLEMVISPVPGVRRLRTQLIYRFRPGPLGTGDPASVVLDSMVTDLPNP